MDINAQETLVSAVRIDAEHKFTSSIDRDEYCKLLLSRRPLIRRDDPRGGLVGLVDAQTGEWFVVKENSLHATRD